ncbi:MAG: HlyD family efflux transporter periplasmic adaptor subunit [Opitutae bacterium]|nr:HlyD family efflux transporter periplasmic adaptor subunit [Opitutae bacterium]
MNTPPPSPIPAASGSVRKPGPASARWQKRLPWVGGAILLGLIVVGLWPQALPVEIATAASGELRVTVDDEGQTRVKHRYVVSSPVAGQLRRIDWKAGAAVEAGKTVLAVLETGGADFLDARSQLQAEARVRGAEAAREMAAAQLERAKAAAELAKTDFARQQALRQQQAISAQEFDAATWRARATAEELRAAEFARQVAEHELTQARALLARGLPDGAAHMDRAQPLEITSPVSGRILRVFQESSRLVPGGFPLLEVGDPTDLEVRIEVLSRDGVAVRPGAKVFLEQWGGAQPLEARVRWVEPSAFTKISALGVEEQRVYVVADLIDPPEKRPTLGDSYRVEARVVVWEGKNVLQVPAGAVFQRGGAWQTYVVSGGAARLRAVQVGHTNGLATEILGGVQVGEQVILYPGDKVTDGARVRPMSVSRR